MSDLKSYTSNRIYWAVDERPADKEDALLVGEKFYLKSEADKQLRHHKYKRCLAMSMWCRRNRLHASVCGPVEKIDFWEKWRKRWLELAEKFKLHLKASPSQNAKTLKALATA
jgi:hypothetical protein